MELAREEHEWADEREVRRRQDEAIARFDDEITDAFEGVVLGVIPAEQAREMLDTLHRALLSSWRRYALINDPDVEARFYALDMAIFIASGDAHQLQTERLLKLWPIGIALRDLRKALTAYQRHQDMPEREFPDSKDLIELAHPGGRNEGLDGVRTWLMRQKVV